MGLLCFGNEDTFVFVSSELSLGLAFGVDDLDGILLASSANRLAVKHR